LNLVSQPFIVVLALNLPPSWKDHACFVHMFGLEFETAIRGNGERELFPPLLRFVRGTTPWIQRTYLVLENICVLFHKIVSLMLLDLLSLICRAVAEHRIHGFIMRNFVPVVFILLP